MFVPSCMSQITPPMPDQLGFDFIQYFIEMVECYLEANIALPHTGHMRIVGAYLCCLTLDRFCVR
jgi:hypothetical protein